MEKASLQRLSSGWPELDVFLGGGWWNGRLHELCGENGGGKATLALQAAAALSRQQQCVAWIGLGGPPYPPALHQLRCDLGYLLRLQPRTAERCLWAAEQAVRSGVFPLVLLAQVPLGEKEARRLQLAAEKSAACVLLLQAKAQTAYPLHLQMHVRRRGMHRLQLAVSRSKFFLPSFSFEVNLHATDPNTEIDVTDSGALLPPAAGLQIAS